MKQGTVIEINGRYSVRLIETESLEKVKTDLRQHWANEARESYIKANSIVATLGDRKKV